MGKYNSSLTRVQPVFDYINADREKLNDFFSLFGKDIVVSSKIISYKYGFDEAAIKPCRELLKWCVENVNQLNDEEFEKLKYKTTSTDKKRYNLFKGDIQIKQQALAELKQDKLPQKAWYIFEGYTHPDIYIETENQIFIGEAKRTESTLTSSTTWLKVRDQLIRHIDSVIDSDKKVYSFFILENPALYELDKYINDDNDFYKNNLPHRSLDIVEKIKKTYLGYTTWNEINEKFGNEIEYPNAVE